MNVLLSQPKGDVMSCLFILQTAMVVRLYSLLPRVQCGVSAARALRATAVLVSIFFVVTFLPTQAQVTLVLNTPSQLPERVGDWKQAQWNAQISVIVQSPRPQPFTITATIRNLDNNATLFRTTAQTRQFQTSPRPLFATDIFPSGSFDYDRSVAESVIRSGMIPEGQYELCVAALSPAGQTLAAQCRQFLVVIPDPPSLITPANGDTIARVGALTGATATGAASSALSSPTILPMFQWTPVIAGTNRQPRYRLRVVPLFDGQQPRQALEGNPVLIDKIVVGSNYQWLPSDPLFSNYPSAKGFAWQVQSVESNIPINAPTNVTPSIGASLRTIARNEGRSEMFVFRVGRVSSSSAVPAGIAKSTSKRTHPFDNSPKGTGLIGRNTPLPMSMIKGAIQWSFRKSALSSGIQPMKNASSVADKSKTVLCTGETVSVLAGDNVGSPSTAEAIAQQADVKQYPLSKLTVKVVARREKSPVQPVKFGNPLTGKMEKFGVTASSADILLGTATTDANGAFAVEFVNPVFAKQGAKIGDTVVKVKKKYISANQKEVEVLEEQTIPLYANTGEYEQVTVHIIAESPYFLLESKSFVMKADSVRKTIDVGTLRGLARTFRLKPEVFVRTRSASVGSQGKTPDAGNVQASTKPASNVQVTILREASFYQDMSVLAPEKAVGNLPVKIGETVAGVPCVRLQSAKASSGNALPLLTPMFLNQSGGMHDRFYVRVQADKCETLETVLQVNGGSIAPDGMVEVTQRFVLNSAGGSLVRGSIRRLNLEDASPSASLSSVPTVGLDKVQLALVPFLVAEPNVQARLNVSTAPDGSFVIDSVPKGAYLLQVAGAALYFNEQYQLATWKPSFVIGKPSDSQMPTGTESNFEYKSLKSGSSQDAASVEERSPGILVVVDGQSEEEEIKGYVVSPLAVVCGRMTDELENMTEGIEITTDKLKSAKAKTDKDGRFVINVPYGSNVLSVKRSGFQARTITRNVEPVAKFFIPPVDVFSVDAPDDKAAASGTGKGSLDNLLIKLKGMDKINPGNTAKTSVGDLFSSGLMKGIATVAMSSMVNTSSLLPVGANSDVFTMSGTGYASTATPIKGLSIQSVKGAYSPTEANLFGAFTADIFSNGSAAGKQAFGKDAAWLDATWYDTETESSASASAAPTALTQNEAGSNPITIVDIGVQQITRSVSLAVAVQSKSGAWIDKARVTVGSKTSTTTNTNGNQTPATIKGLQPGTVSVRVEGPEEANCVPHDVDVVLSAKDDVTQRTVKLEVGGRVTGTVTAYDANGKVLALDDKANAELLKNVRVRVKGLEDLIYTTVKPDGSFVLRGVKTGSSTIVVAVQGFVSDEKSVSLKENETQELKFILKKSAIALETLFGFPIEIAELKQTGTNTATVSGAFVNIPNNAVFSLPSGTRIPFKDVQLTQENGVWVPAQTTISTDLPQLSVRAFGAGSSAGGKSLPLLVRGGSNKNTNKNTIAFQASNGNKLKGLVVGDVSLDYNEFINLGKGPWLFQELGSYVLDNVPPLFRSDGTSTPSNLVLKFPKRSGKAQIYSIGTSLALDGATLDAQGLHLKGSVQLTDAGFADVFGVGEKAVKFVLKEFHIKPNASIGNVDVEIGSGGVAFSKGVFNFNLSSLDFTVEGLRIAGTVGFSVGDGILAAQNIGFSDLMMFTSQQSKAFGIAAGVFTFESKNVKIAGFPLAGKGFTFGIVPNSSPMQFFLSGASEITGLPHIGKLGLSLSVQSDGKASASAAADYEASWAGIATFKLAGMSLDVEKKTLDVAGSIGLSIPGVAALQGGGFIFTPNGLQEIKSFGGEIDLKIAKLNIGALSFGENNPDKQVQSPPSTKGNGPQAVEGTEDEASPALYGSGNKGFRADNVNLTIPGIGLNASASFWYYSLSGGGLNIGADIIVPNGGIPPITLGPVFIKPTGGGFDLDTKKKDIALRLYSSISIAGAEDIVAFNPTVMEIRAGANAGVQIGGKALLQLFNEQTGDATFSFAPVQAKFRVNANVYKKFEPLFGIHSVSASGQANITVDLDGKQGYMYAGVGLDATVNVINLMEAKALGGLVLGYNVPRSAMTPEQANVLPSAALDKFSGIAFLLDTKIGKEEHQAKTHDIGICDAKVWAYSKAGARFYALRSNGNNSFGFEMNSAWGAGARCGCVSAGVDIAGAIGGGYNRNGADTGWFFGAKRKGSAELCLKWCLDLDVEVEVRYQQRNSTEVYFDIGVDW